MGCRSHAPSASPGSSRAPSREVPVITPATPIGGKVLFVDRPARFAVITFSITDVPQNGQRLSVYRKGLKVGELKVTGPREESNTVADIVAGEVQPNDEVRED